MRCLIVQGPLLHQGPRSSIHSLPSSLKPWFSSHHPLILSTCFQLAFSIFQKKKKSLIPPFSFQLVYTTLFVPLIPQYTICCPTHCCFRHHIANFCGHISIILLILYCIWEWTIPPSWNTSPVAPAPYSPGGLSIASTSHLSFRLHVDKSSKFEFLASQGTHQTNYDKIP